MESRILSAAIFGAAAGTGLALVIGMTIVVYHYYTVKRNAQYWNDLESYSNPPCRRRWNGRRSYRYGYTSRNVNPPKTLERRQPPPKCYYSVEAEGLSKMPDKLSKAISDLLDMTCRSGRKPAETPPRSAESASPPKLSMAGIRMRWAQKCGRASSESTAGPSGSGPSTSSQESTAAGDQRCPHPSTSVEGGQAHQCCSYMGPSTSSGSSSRCGGRFFGRHSPMSSQSSMDSPGGQVPPKLLTTGPDGRYHYDPLNANSYPPTTRCSPPGRAVRMGCYGNPASFSGSPTSNASTSSFGSVPCVPTHCTSKLNLRTGACNVLPLLIPPTRASYSEGGAAPPASPLGTLEPHLYQPRENPVFITAQCPNEVMCRLHLRLDYDFDRSDLLVHLIEVQQLPGLEDGGFSEPYVTLEMIPEVDSRKRQSNIHAGTSNPVFDENFKFPVSHDELHGKLLFLQILDDDCVSRNNVIGTLKIELNTLEVSSALEIWGEVEREYRPYQYIQEVKLTLSYQPSAGRLTVVIREARNLTRRQDRRKSFVKVILTTENKKIKKKTRPKSESCPVWNESICFNIPHCAIPESAIKISVVETCSDLRGGHVVIGSCVVGPSVGTDAAGSRGRDHWVLMTNSPRESITMWHQLH